MAEKSLDIRVGLKNDVKQGVAAVDRDLQLFYKHVASENAKRWEQERREEQQFRQWLADEKEKAAIQAEKAAADHARREARARETATREEERKQGLAGLKAQLG